MFTENIGAKVGLALSQALIVTGMLQYGLLRTTDVVSQMTSVERVLDYKNIEKEPELESAPGKQTRDCIFALWRPLCSKLGPVHTHQRISHRWNMNFEMNGSKSRPYN
jgi:hypothetical protein